MTAVALRPVCPTPLDRALPLLESLVSRFAGIVLGTVEYLHAPDEAQLVSVGCTVAHSEALIGQRTTDHGGGAHWHRDAARAAAVGEAVERYSASYVPEARLVLDSAEELGADAVDPQTFSLFHGRQYAAPRFPFRPFERSTRVRWVRGCSLATGAEALLPAQLVYMEREWQHPGETPVGYATSNGVACAATFEEAALAGLLELVERDAFMIAWYDRLSLPLLDVAASPRLAEADERYFAPSGLRRSAVDLSAFFGIPAVLGVVHGVSGHAAALGVGGGCAPTIEEAWRKAMSEAYGVLRWVRDAALEPGRPLPADRDEIRDFEDHIRFYASEGRAAAASFLDAETARTDPDAVVPLPGANVAEQIAAVVARLAARGVSAFAVDVTAPDVREAGLSVVRVVAPELCPLDVIDTARYLGGRRLYHAAHELGLAPAPLTIEDLNPLPHPFP